jgi:PAP2 superfamily
MKLLSSSVYKCAPLHGLQKKLSLNRTITAPVVSAVILLVAIGWTSLAHAASIDPVGTWNEQALRTVREKNAIDAQAARLYAMVNIAMYDAVNGIASRHGNKQDRAFAIVDPAAAPNGDIYAAAVAAAHAVLIGEYPDRASIYNAQKVSDLSAIGSSDKATAGEQWGAAVGAQVRAARMNDGSSPTEPAQPPGMGPGQFRGSFTNPQFRNLQPFGIANSSAYYGAGPAPLPSLDYAAAFDVVKFLGKTTPNTGSAAENAQKLGTFQFWAFGNNTSQPPGAWIQVALAVLGTHPLDLPDATRLLALETMAMADTVAPTFMTKFVFHHWRPTTAIREATSDGNDLTIQEDGWTSRGGVGGTPEYWSGHSSFSAAAAQVLAGFFCDDNISFTFTADTTAPFPPNQPRSYPSFSAAAEEAGISRIYGGLHFPFSNQDGLIAGRGVAREILANKLLLLRGETHFGGCPR